MLVSRGRPQPLGPPSAAAWAPSVRGPAGRLLTAAASLSVSVCLAACGPEEPPPTPIADIATSDASPSAPNGIDARTPAAALRTTLTALSAAGSFRVEGSNVGDASIDLWFDLGVGAKGMVEATGAVSLLARDGQVYVRADEAFLASAAGEDIDATIAGKWLLLPENERSAYRIFADGAGFAEQLMGGQQPTRITGLREVEGQPAVGLVFGDSGFILWVAAEGEPLPLQLEQEGGTAEAGVLRFSGFGEAVTIAAPTEDEVVDVAAVVDDAAEVAELDIEKQLDEEFGVQPDVG